VLLLGYLLSLRLHPYTSCRACKGRGRNRGGVYRFSFGDCGRCAGKGRKLRLGVRMFGKPDRYSSGS
jgi:DnaJ-class molecular chaperone